ncbi:hypothetical protein GEV33_005723 [Tenebrio molitor]|uniref:Uncharacterized protein n=1 Tax=Tenebrio molitor TaxID=7067 RepID=A0A8J6HP21_TENMO|nr:hypothetical protein GEV33_005723 [Tenebrio molitor]
MRCSDNYRDALSRNGIRTRSIVCSPRFGGNKKNPSRAEIRGLGRRPPSGPLCRKSRAANHVRGVRDPQSSGVAVRHIIRLGHRQTNYRCVRNIVSFPVKH